MRVLVVSDNPVLCDFFRQLVSGEEYSCCQFDFKFSARNQSPEALLSLSMQPIDMADFGTIDRVVADYQLVISAHCKQIFPAALVNQVRCINIHPGLNPYNRGWYPQVFSIINGLPAGVTIHEMDEQIDHGAIIVQQPVQVELSDTSESVYNRILQTEKELLTTWLPVLLSGDYHATLLTEEGNYNSPRDFEALCELDLQHQGTLQEHLNLLRALTHGSYNNAYFVDDKGQRHYVGVKISTKS